MALYKNQYRVESSRLAGWDYSSSTWYFVTICTHDRACLFGLIEDDQMRLSMAGEIVADQWSCIAADSPHVSTDQFVIMPNHLHGIVILIEAPMETHLRGLSTPEDLHRPTLGSIIRQFKSRSTSRIWAAGHREFGWQARYHDRIIRGDRALAAIRKYIVNNPSKWALDKETPRIWVKPRRDAPPARG